MAMTPLTGMPDRSQSQSTFDTNASSFFSTKLPLFVTEANALQVDVDAKRTLAETAATTATTQAGIATTQAGIATTQATLAQDWATKTSGAVSGGEFSAKYHAIAAAASAASAVNSPGTQATSNSSMTIGAVSQSFMLQQTGKAFAVGQWVAVSDLANPSINWMLGAITAFNSASGDITVNVALVSGSGTLNSWSITQAAPSNVIPSPVGHEGKSLGVNAASAAAYLMPQPRWTNFTVIVSNGGTFTVPDLTPFFRAYVFGAGGQGAAGSGTGGGGGGACAFGTIPCKPGEVFTFNTGAAATLKKGATTYLSAGNGTAGSGTTGGAGSSTYTIGGGLGITGYGGTGGGGGGNGNGTSQYGSGGASGSPIGTGGAGVMNGGGGGWGSPGFTDGGGGVSGYTGSALYLSGAYSYDGVSPAARDWSNAFTDPLLAPCNFVQPPLNAAAYGASGNGAIINAPAGCGGGKPTSGNTRGGNGGLGGGGGPANGNAVGGRGGLGGGGGVGPSGYGSGAGGYGGGGAGGNPPGGGGLACAVIFW